MSTSWLTSLQFPHWKIFEKKYLHDDLWLALLMAQGNIHVDRSRIAWQNFHFMAMKPSTAVLNQECWIFYQMFTVNSILSLQNTVNTFKILFFSGEKLISVFINKHLWTQASLCVFVPRYLFFNMYLNLWTKNPLEFEST